MKLSNIAFRTAALLWIVWGLVHLLAGVLTLSLPSPAAFAGIADAVDPAALEMTYPDAVSAILHQHGWNLGWGGLTTVLCAPWVWRGDARAIFLAALVGGMLDAGYFLFLDLGGYVHFVPGTIMTIVSASAIGLSVYGHFATRGRAA